MSLVENFEQIILGKDEEGFAFTQVYDYIESGGQKKEGRIFFTLEMPNNPLLAEEIAKDIFDCLKENFYLEMDRDPYLRFEDSLKKINEVVLKKEKEKEFKFISNLSIAIGVIARDNLYLTQAGDAEVYLVRGKYVSVITEGLSEDDAVNELFSNVASGALEDSDTVILSSTKLLRYLTEIDLSKLFSNYNLPEALKELRSLLKREVSNKVAILGIEVKEKELLNEEDKVEIVGISKVSGRRELLMKLSVAWPVLKAKIMNLNKFDKQNFQDFFLFFKGKKNVILLLSIIMVLTLSVSVYSLQVKSREKKESITYAADLLHAKENVDLAKQRSYDKEKAGALLDAAEKNTLKVLQSGYLKAEAIKNLEIIKSQRDMLDNVIRISSENLRLVADLSQKRSNVNAIGLLSYQDTLYAFEYNALYKLLLDSASEPLTIDDNEYVVRGTYFEDRDSLVFLTKSGQIIEFKDGVFTFMDTEDKAWHSGMDVAAYSDKLYVLDADNNQIWKYKRKRDKYSVPEKFVSDGDLTGGVSISIDGSVYLLKSNGIIENYYVGKKQVITIDNQPIVPMEKPKVLYTEKDMDQVYVLEPEKKRVLLYNKVPGKFDLIYKSQYVFEDVKDEIKDFYVDKKARKMNLLTASKVYEMAM